MSTVQDTDLILVQRGNVPHKCTFADWKASQASVNKPSLLTPADGAGQTIAAVSDEIVSYGTVTVTPPATAAESKQVPVNTFAVGEEVLASKLWTLGVARPGGALPLGNAGSATQWGVGGDIFMLRFDAPTIVTAGRVTGLVPMSLASSDDGLTWKLEDNKPGPGYNDPANALRGTAPHKYWALFRASASAPTKKLAEMDGVYSFSGIPTDTNVLTLKTSQGLAGFAAGDAITEVGGGDDATGTVGSVDVTAKTITLSASAGTWDVGSTVLGAPKLSTDAAVGETPTFTSTAFAITGTGVTHASSDWQVTLKADTTFASPVVQSMADATNLVSWAGGPLQPNTDYIARVRHNGSGGVQSPWSDVIGFKTAEDIGVTIPPSDFKISTDMTTWTDVTAPVKFINVTNNYGDFFGFGTDGHLYKIANTGGAAQDLGSFSASLPAGATAIQGGCGYNGSIVILDSKGGLHSYKGEYVPQPGVPVNSINDAEADIINASTAACDTAIAISNKLQKVYIYAPGTSAPTVTLDGVTCPSFKGWIERTTQFNFLFTQHSGHKIKQLITIGLGSSSAAYYNLGASAVIYDDGVMYINKQLVAGTFESVMPSISGYGETACFYARQADGTIKAYGTNAAALTTAWPSGCDRYSLYQGNGVYIKDGKWHNQAGTDLGFKAPPQDTLPGFVPFVSHIQVAGPIIIPVLP